MCINGKIIKHFYTQKSNYYIEECKYPIYKNHMATFLGWGYDYYCTKEFQTIKICDSLQEAKQFMVNYYNAEQNNI